MDILLVCTANICRSAMAEAMLRRRLEERGVAAAVHSAGLLEAGRRVPGALVTVLRDRGIDVDAHRSRALAAELVEHADLVLTMERVHARETIVLSPGSIDRTFTLKELVRRGEKIGPRAREEPVPFWLARARAGRSHAELLGSSRDDDVADPYGAPKAVYARTADEVDDLLDRLVNLMWPARL